IRIVGDDHAPLTNAKFNVRFVGCAEQPRICCRCAINASANEPTRDRMVHMLIKMKGEHSANPPISAWTQAAQVRPWHASQLRSLRLRESLAESHHGAGSNTPRQNALDAASTAEGQPQSRPESFLAAQKARKCPARALACLRYTPSADRND